MNQPIELESFRGKGTVTVCTRGGGWLRRPATTSDNQMARKSPRADGRQLRPTPHASATTTFNWKGTVIIGAIAVAGAYTTASRSIPAASTSSGLVTKAAAAARCRHNMFRIAASSIRDAGDGVFSKVFIKRGHVCCFFDGRDVFDEAELSGFQDYGLNFEQTAEVDRPGVRFGLRGVPEGCGVVSMMNDAAAPIKLKPRTTLAHIQQQIAEYERVASRTNAVEALPGGDPFVFYATRDIAPGDELYYSYGAHYWLTREAEALASPLLALAVWMTIPENDATVFRYEADEQRIGLEGGRELTDEAAARFMVGFLRLRPDSAVWSRFEGASPQGAGRSARPAKGRRASSSSSSHGHAERLQAMVAHVAGDGELFHVEREL